MLTRLSSYLYFSNRALFLYRISFASCSLYAFIGRWQIVHLFYADGPLFSPTFTRQYWRLQPTETIESMIGQYLALIPVSAPLTQLLFGLLGTCCIGILWHQISRFCYIGFFLIVGFFQFRFPGLDMGEDVYMILGAFWGFFLPQGSWSESSRKSYVGLAYLVHICVLYACAGLGKVTSSGLGYLNGQLFKYLSEFTIFVTPAGREIFSLAPDGTIIPYLIPWIETLAPLLLIICWPITGIRMLMVGTLALFHVGTHFAFELSMLPVLAIVALIPLVPPRSDFDKNNSIECKFRSPHKMWPALAFCLLMSGLNIGVLLSMGSYLSYNRSWPVKLLSGIGLRPKYFFFAEVYPHLNGFYVFSGKTSRGESLIFDLKKLAWGDTAEFQLDHPSPFQQFVINRHWQRVWLLLLLKRDYALSLAKNFMTYLCLADPDLSKISLNFYSGTVAQARETARLKEVLVQSCARAPTRPIANE